ncbi:MAG TPA: hypothetical protein VMK82_09655 [Steroidobacteraceae bacterium]|nr:hypothetical protein [Steroidobacteraceae bacterium]
MKKNLLYVAAAGLLALAAANAANAAQAAATACDRACLEGMVERYLDAVTVNNPSAVPLSPNVRFTEDGQRLLIGDGLWNTMKGKGKYRLFVTDVPAGQVTVLATIQEDHREAANFNGSLIALRLRVANRQITEIEQIVFRFPNETGQAHNRTYSQVDAMQTHPKYLQAVPAGERMSRADLITQGNKYFTGLQKNDGKGDYPFGPECDRHENGGRATNSPTPAGQTRPDPKTATGYSGQWTCIEQFESGLMYFVNRIRDRRFVAVDQERGIVFAFAFFDHSGGETRKFKTPGGRDVVAGPVQPHTWQIAEVFKIEKGLITKIDAFLQRSPYGMNAGWSTWEQGMSDQVRDVTFEAPTGI